MSDIDEKVEELSRILEEKGDSYVSHAEKVLAEIVDLHDVDCIGSLISCFDDDSEYDELMFSIIHAIEVFEWEDYVTRVIRSLPQLLQQAPRWAEILHIRILNSEACRHAYVEAITGASTDQRESARALLAKLVDAKPKFAEKAKPVLLRL